MVEIEWNKDKVIKHKLGLRGWDPKNPTQGTWRMYLGNANA
jgi:hypothetical protein